MRYAKIAVVVCMIVAFGAVTSSAVWAQAERDEEQICSDMTYGQLAHIMANILELPLPDNFNDLEKTEQFEIESNLLSENGIPDFSGYEHNAKVTRGFAAEVLVKALGLEGRFQTPDEKIGYLANLGYISRGGVEEILTDCQQRIAEAYTPPPQPELPSKPDDDPERPVSKVQ